jgi:hypothetical protein
VRHIWSMSALLVLFGASGIAGDDGDREKLLGSWVEAGNAAASGWTFERKNDSFQIRQLQGNNPIADYACKADGQECEIKTSERKAKISMWFNGPRLVQLETEGSRVVKRRFAILPQGDTMELEIIPIVPGGKAETIQFKRGELSARGK